MRSRNLEHRCNAVGRCANLHHLQEARQCPAGKAVPAPGWGSPFTSLSFPKLAKAEEAEGLCRRKRPQPLGLGEGGEHSEAAEGKDAAGLECERFKLRRAQELGCGPKMPSEGPLPSDGTARRGEPEFVQNLAFQTGGQAPSFQRSSPSSAATVLCCLFRPGGDQQDLLANRHGGEPSLASRALPKVLPLVATTTQQTQRQDCGGAERDQLERHQVPAGDEASDGAAARGWLLAFLCQSSRLPGGLLRS